MEWVLGRDLMDSSLASDYKLCSRLVCGVVLAVPGKVCSVLQQWSSTPRLPASASLLTGGPAHHRPLQHLPPPPHGIKHLPTLSSNKCLQTVCCKPGMFWLTSINSNTFSGQGCFPQSAFKCMALRL